MPRAAASAEQQRAIQTANSIEGLIVSSTGAAMIIGWLDDALDPLECVRVIGADWRMSFDGAALARVRRPDVEASLGRGAHPFGFFGFLCGQGPIDPVSPCLVELEFANRASAATTLQPRSVDDEELRDTVLGYLSSSEHFGNRQVKAIACVAQGLGEQVLRLNRRIIGEIVASPYVERFGRTLRRPVGSIVVCLYGRSEYLPLQQGLFSNLPGASDYEFIYVCNSPELSETLLREARIAVTLYDVSITLVLLPGNAGFGAANNAGVAAATSGRILIVNPDVFPRDLDWASRHTALVQTLPRDRVRLFGVPLYYDDGSLMHGGMFFELDRGVAFNGRRSLSWQLLRVEHYGKGAPADSAAFTASRPVPAVTGAFMSVEREWYETLEGFTVDYVFGHYEDADLCLKSLAKGAPTWLHDIRLWHLEGKGSTRLPVHEGGSILNRWVFSSKWGETASNGLLGQAPELPELQAPANAPQVAPRPERAR